MLYTEGGKKQNQATGSTERTLHMIDKQQGDLYAEAQAIVKHYRPIEELIPTHWNEDYVLANDVHLHYYRTGGDKPALLLLHGFNEYGLTWLRVAKELEGNYDVIMVDARGHGRSDGIAKVGYPPEANVEDTAGVIRALKLGRARIIGLSMGGTTALRLAARYPELVHSFIFEGWGDESGISKAAANSEGYQAWFNTWLAWLEQLKTMNYEERMISALPQLLPMMGGSLWSEDEYVPMVEAYKMFDLDLAKYSMKLWDSEYQGDPAALLKQVTCPALIMKHAWAFPKPGTQPAVRVATSEQPNIRIVYFEDTGHLIRRVAFEQYMALVWEFLRAH
jgi:pimeloyl-ACP methyl ester carboxylesterase